MSALKAAIIGAGSAGFAETMLERIVEAKGLPTRVTAADARRKAPEGALGDLSRASFNASGGRLSLHLA
ncbi:alpha-galactosidase/6-phospho-beta-glucosidase family protein [Martelella radicis]|uniref:Alpha-galactosidase/6-phospho-beta-glucosidase family protein n=1 Tax=Martelella radicis TaxID=1397476 RepID=A0A7W6KR38_9HYPH|nr:hypothetical protein [Martelella radicis]MBB4124550.1 alpha-galactosidase/6-phospho-beta-glucosidase family protein [Martelella radicis]